MTVLDAGKIRSDASLQQGTFTKAFSNAAMHWILRNPDARTTFFQDVNASLAPGGTFSFEMGGLGNVAEMRAALQTVVARRVGVQRAREADPWFFPDEGWITRSMEAAGFRVDKIETEWRPTTADRGGVEGWVRLFGTQMFDAVDPADREECVKEVVDALSFVCRKPDGGEMISYVRLRALGTKV